MRDRRIGIRLTTEQLAMIDRKAERGKLSRTAFIIRACEGIPITVIDGGVEVARELHKIGVNLNQLTALCNSGRIYAVDLTDMSGEVRTLWQSLNL